MTKSLNRFSFILGSGASLLRLTNLERSLLNRHPCTLAMNKYLLFHEKLDIIPSDFFLADRQFPSHLVADRSLKVASKIKEKITFYLHSYYSDIYNPLLNWKTPENRWLHRSDSVLKCLIKRSKILLKHK
jgi:hypothetical protein